MKRAATHMAIALAGGTYLVSFALAAAEPDQDPAVLEEMTVEGDWLGIPDRETIRTYPGARSLVTETDIHESGARDLEDALRLVPGVRVQDETGTGVLPNIGVRGLNPARSERVMVLVDGIPVALAPYTGTGLSLFPVTMQSIQAIDVARGGVAVRYGPNNVGGVINFITKPISRDFSATLKESLSIATGNGNVLTDTYLRAGGFVNDSLGLQLQANTIQGEGWRDHSDNDVHNILLDADWFINDRSSLKGRLQYYKTGVDLPGALSPQTFQQDRTQSQRPYDYFKSDTWRGSLTYTQYFDNGEFNWTNFAHTSQREFAFGQPFDPALPATDVSTSPRDFFVVGSEPRVTFAVPFAGIDHQITVGGRFVREEVDFIVDRQNLASGALTQQRNWRFETDAFAGYISDTISFLDDRLKITPGLRYENVYTRFNNRLANDNSNNRAEELLPGFDVGYHLNDWLFLFGNTHRSLRPPQVAQVTREGDVGAEVALNYEAGIRLTPSASLDATLTAFRIDFDNQIEFDRASQQFRNLGETRHQGMELETNWYPQFLPGFNMKASYTLLDGKQMKGQFAGNDLPFASEHQITLAGNYEWNNYNFNLNGHYQSAAFSDAANTSAEDITGTVGKVPAYWLWNMAVSKEFNAFNDTKAKVGLGLNNIFDRAYYFRGVDVSPVGRVPGPGRTVMLNLQMDI
jgi:Fe(3+) dicitrate transport protein